MLDIIKNRMAFFAVSWVLFVFAVFSIFFFNLNFWIDMTWWTQMEFDYENTVDMESIQALVEEEKENFKGWIINTTNTYKIAWENKFVVETWFDKNVWEEELESYKVDFKEGLTKIFKEDNITLSKYTNIWASFWDYIKDTAKLTLLIAILWIAVYVAYAFSGSISGITSLSFAIITIVTLFHDVVISSWLYILTSSFLPEFKIDTFFITALLTILWYSINDTIVAFDRIRANLKRHWWKDLDLKEIINRSVHQTLTRSMYTSLTLAFVLFTIFVFGPETIKWFTLVMIFGTIVGTYSSVFIASPMLFEINKNKKLQVYKKKVIRPEDKIVV